MGVVCVCEGGEVCVCEGGEVGGGGMVVLQPIVRKEPSGVGG